MKRSYRRGSVVKLSADALDNYGHEHADRSFIVEQWYDHYCKPGADDEHGHPGFDSAAVSPLYHLAGLNFDLYAWELEPAKEAK